MKKQLLALAVLLLAFVAVEYYVQSTKKNLEVAPAPAEEDLVIYDDNGVGEEGGLEELDTLDVPEVAYSGAYVVYQERRRNEDGVDETTLYRFHMDGKEPVTAIAEVHPTGGGAHAELIGDEVFVRRFSGNMNALVSLDGSFVSVEDPFNRISSADGNVWLDWTPQWGNQVPSISMTIQRQSLDNNQNVIAVVIDPAELDIDFGYAMPFLISDDGKTVYLALTCECDNPYLERGLWMFDVETQKFTKVTEVIEKDIQTYMIDPTTNLLIGATFDFDTSKIDGPSRGEPIAPSTMYLLDLREGTSRVLLESDLFAFRDLFLSPSGKQYTYSLGDDVIRLGTVGVVLKQQDTRLSGRVLDWVGDTLVVDRDGELVLYSLTTDTVTPIARSVGSNATDPDFVYVNYVGTITIK